VNRTRARAARALAPVVLLAVAAVGQAPGQAAGQGRSGEGAGCRGVDARDLVERSLEAVNSGQLDLLGDTLAVDYQQDRVGVPDGLEGAKAFFGALRSVYPDLRVQATDLLVQRDRITAFTVFSGTRAGVRSSMRTADLWTVRNCRLATHVDVVEDPAGFLAPLAARP
jgi:predicted SnoaL-like aldol condensation-catalyzing enzyme